MTHFGAGAGRRGSISGMRDMVTLERRRSMCRAAQNSDASPADPTEPPDRPVQQSGAKVSLTWQEVPKRMQPAKTRSLDNVDEHLHT